MGISMSLLPRKMYTEWVFLIGMVYLSTLLCHLGLINALSIFKVNESRFFDLLDSCVIIYLDDISVFSRTKEDHKHDLNAVFKRL